MRHPHKRGSRDCLRLNVTMAVEEEGLVVDVACGSPQSDDAEQCWQIDLTRKRKTRGDRERRRRSVERMSWGDGGKEEGATCCKFKMHPGLPACPERKLMEEDSKEEEEE